MSLRPSDDLFLIDASSFLHRDHHASKAQDEAYNRNHRGEPIGAIKRFMERLFWWRKRPVLNREPTHIGIVFDAGRRNWRHDVFPAYKSGRPPLDEELAAQLPLMRPAAEALGLCIVEQAGYEADDLIATYALTAVEMEAACLIISGDKDLLQLVRPGVCVFDPPAGVEGFPGYRPARVFHREEVEAKFGVPPELVVDVQGLAGDPGDGVPGVPGVGIGKASKLIREYGSMEAVLEAAPAMAAVKKPLVMWTNIAQFADQARVSRCIVKLDSTVDYEVGIDEMLLHPLHHERAIAFAEDLGMPSVVATLRKDLDFIQGRSP